MDPQQIADALIIDEDTVNRHISEYQTDEKLKPENGTSNFCKFLMIQFREY